MLVFIILLILSGVGIYFFMKNKTKIKAKIVRKSSGGTINTETEEKTHFKKELKKQK